MDWEELENILRSRESEPDDLVIGALMKALGRQLDFIELHNAVDRLISSYWERESSL